MRTRISLTCLIALAIMLAGCNTTYLTSSGSRYSGVYYGELGLKGEDNELTLLDGTDLTKLSVMGKDNRVVVRPGANVMKVEIVGEDNRVECPAGMSVEYTEIGEDNELKFR